jgi:hypothetical protein
MGSDQFPMEGTALTEKATTKTRKRMRRLLVGTAATGALLVPAGAANAIPLTTVFDPTVLPPTVIIDPTVLPPSTIVTTLPPTTITTIDPTVLPPTVIIPTVLPPTTIIDPTVLPPTVLTTLPTTAPVTTAPATTAPATTAPVTTLPVTTSTTLPIGGGGGTDTAPPGVTLASKIVAFIKSGAFSFGYNLSEPGTATGTLFITLPVKGASAAAKKKTYKIGSGKTVSKSAGKAKMKVKLNRKGKALAKKSKKLKTKLQLKVVDASGNAKKLNRSVTLKRK